jgi:carbon starvation protein CstA
MYKDNPTVAVIVSIAFILTCLGMVIYFTRGLIAQDKIIFLGIFMATILAGAWIADNIIMPSIPLMDAEENKLILQIMSSIISFVLGFYAGVKKNDIGGK